MLKIEFDAENKLLAQVIGLALCNYSKGVIAAPEVINTASSTTETEKAALQQEAADTIEELAGSTATTSGRLSAGADSSATPELDEKGVAFNGQFCGKAAQPFYGSGKRKGQWKKRKGVSDDAYDEWYATELLGSNIVEEVEEVADEPINTAGAFGGGNNTPAATAPSNAGELAAYISEKQTAGLMGQNEVLQAYNMAGYEFKDLFDPSKEPTVAAAVHAAIENLIASKGA